MARPDKAAAVSELKNKFTSSNGAVLTEYRGLTVAALRELRRSLGEDATYAVTKNTLTQIAAREAGIDGIDEHLAGPTAIAFIDGDPVVVAKGLRDFAKAHPLLVIKGGVLEGKTLSADEVKQLADLESRETLLAKLAGAMKGTMANAASLFNAPLSQAARVIAALEAKAQEDPGVIAGAGTPAADEAAAPEATQTAAAPAAEDSTPAADAADEN
ncbi:MAG: 50S ribosomal protein L10 [Microlunatus sp.]|nr:50S ribosomal protein L10 [Microlunatus sp.]